MMVGLSANSYLCAHTARGCECVHESIRSAAASQLGYACADIIYCKVRSYGESCFPTVFEVLIQNPRHSTSKQPR